MVETFPSYHRTTDASSVEPLCNLSGNVDQSITLQLHLSNHSIEAFSYFDQRQQFTEDLSQGSIEFLLSQILKHVLSGLPKNEQAKHQMIQICKEHYWRNAKEIKRIEEFERTYQSRDAIRWYSKQCFAYELIDRALRTKDIELLYKLHPFVFDLSNSLKREYMKSFSSTKGVLNVYRGVQLEKQEYEKLKKNRENVISTRGYLSTTRLKSKAETFCNKSTKSRNTIPVLFQIECYLEQGDENTVFADITQFTVDQEVLFDSNACFKINFIEETETYATVKMNVSNAGQTVVKEYLAFTKKETGEDNVKILFGKLLCSLAEYDKSKKYFELLFNDSNAEDLGRIEYHIGRALYMKGQLNEARKCYQRAYDDMQYKKQERTIHFAHLLNNLGIVSSDENKFNDALGYYLRALEIKEELYPNDNVDIARSLTNIGITLGDQGRRDESLYYYQRALRIYETSLPAGHIDIISSRSIITEILKHQEKHDESFRHSRPAHLANQSICSTGPFDIISSLRPRAGSPEDRRKADASLHYPQRASTSTQRIPSAERPDLPFSRSRMSETMEHGEKHDESFRHSRPAHLDNQSICSTGPFDIIS
ncbi:unnamed protein product, partial [Rotaria socialis]